MVRPRYSEEVIWPRDGSCRRRGESRDKRSTTGVTDRGTWLEPTCKQFLTDDPPLSVRRRLIVRVQTRIVYKRIVVGTHNFIFERIVNCKRIKFHTTFSPKTLESRGGETSRNPFSRLESGVNCPLNGQVYRHNNLLHYRSFPNRVTNYVLVVHCLHRSHYWRRLLSTGNYSYEEKNKVSGHLTVESPVSKLLCSEWCDWSTCVPEWRSRTEEFTSRPDPTRFHFPRGEFLEDRG